MYYTIVQRTFVERSSLAVDYRTRNRESPGSNPPLLSFRSLGILVLSTMPQFTQRKKKTRTGSMDVPDCNHVMVDMADRWSLP